MTTLEFPSWQKPYQDALLEYNPKILEEKLLAAENAIFARMQELAGISNHHEE